jgi:RHS repeat-associated protein
MASTGRNPTRKRGLQYLRARYYDAESGRFGVQDSYLGQTSDPLSLNRYLYCLSDPLNLIDPSGYSGKYASGRLGAYKSVKRGKWSVVNRSGNPNSLQAHYERTGKTITAAIKACGGIFNYLNNTTVRGAVLSVTRFSASTVGGRRTSSYRQLMAARIRAQIVNYNCGTASHIDAMPERPYAHYPEGAHIALGLAGAVPGWGIPFNVLNAFLYSNEGKQGEALLSLVGASLGFKAATKGISSAEGIINVIVAMGSGPDSSDDE